MANILRVTVAWAGICIALAGYGQDDPQGLSKIAGLKGVAPNSSQAFKFVVLSDRTGWHVGRGFEEAIDQINLLKPDFVMCVGDLIEGWTDAHGYMTNEVELASQWDEMDAMLGKLDAPFFFCPGNHDVSSAQELAIYTKRHGVDGRTYYSFNYKGAHFVVLDSITAGLDPKVGNAMAEWLAKDMAQAGAAQQVFVFFHYPRMKSTSLWTRLLASLPKDKTTVFNGHCHALGAFDDDGVKSYVLSDTGSSPVNGLRTAEGFPMFALVSVDGGKVSVAILPVGEVYPLSIARDGQDCEDLKHAAAATGLATAMAGGPLTFSMANPLDRPIEFTLQGGGSNGWLLAKGTWTVAILPGESKTMSVETVPLSARPRKPELTGTFSFLNRQGKGVQLPIQLPVATAVALDIPIRHGITVDGGLEDWMDVAPLKVATSDRISGNSRLWKGPTDASFELKAATDGERLFIAVRVWDAEVCQTKYKSRSDSDAVEFFWDARTPDKRDGKRGLGTGQIIFELPDGGGALVPKMDGEKEPLKSSLTSHFRLAEGGYVVEFSAPLKDLGMSQATKAGEGINLDLMLDDRDEKDGSTIKHMTTGGNAGLYKNTAGYARGTFRE